MNAIFLNLLENVINTVGFNISCLYYFKFDNKKDKRVQDNPDILLQICCKFAMGVFVELQDSIACILDVYCADNLSLFLRDIGGSAVVSIENSELYSWILVNRVISLFFIGPDLVFSDYNPNVFMLKKYCDTYNIKLQGISQFTKYHIRDLSEKETRTRNRDTHIKYFLCELDSEFLSSELITQLSSTGDFNNRTKDFGFFTNEQYSMWYQELSKLGCDLICGRLDLSQSVGESKREQAGMIYDFWFQGLYLVKGLDVGMAHWSEGHLYFALLCSNVNMYKIQSDINRIYKAVYWYTEYTTMEQFMHMHMSYSGEAYSYYNKYYIGFYNTKRRYDSNLLFNVTLSVASSDGYVDGELGNFGRHEDLDKSFASSFNIFKYYVDNYCLKRQEAFVCTTIYRTEWIATPALLYMIEEKDLDFDDTYIFLSLS